MEELRKLSESGSFKKLEALFCALLFDATEEEKVKLLKFKLELTKGRSLCV